MANRDQFKDRMDAATIVDPPNKQPEAQAQKSA
jgi:hypothetical protein